MSVGETPQCANDSHASLPAAWQTTSLTGPAACTGCHYRGQRKTNIYPGKWFCGGRLLMQPRELHSSSRRWCGPSPWHRPTPLIHCVLKSRDWIITCGEQETTAGNSWTDSLPHRECRDWQWQASPKTCLHTDHGKIQLQQNSFTANEKHLLTSTIRLWSGPCTNRRVGGSIAISPIPCAKGPLGKTPNPKLQTVYIPAPGANSAGDNVLWPHWKMSWGQRKHVIKNSSEVMKRSNEKSFFFFIKPTVFETHGRRVQWQTLSSLLPVQSRITRPKKLFIYWCIIIIIIIIIRFIHRLCLTNDPWET